MRKSEGQVHRPRSGYPRYDSSESFIHRQAATTIKSISFTTRES